MSVSEDQIIEVIGSHNWTIFVDRAKKAFNEEGIELELINLDIQPFLGMPENPLLEGEAYSVIVSKVHNGKDFYYCHVFMTPKPEARWY